MSPELDKKLCEKYPKLFTNRRGSIHETCMAWGFECGDGWFDLLDKLCWIIQSHLVSHADQIKYTKEWNKNVLDETYVWPVSSLPRPRQLREVPEELDQVIVDQVKEKFGTLRFYYSGGDDYISGAVDLAESLSGRICEECGAPAEVKSTEGWVYTRCEQHKIGY